MIGSSIAHYEVLSKLGEGGMGEVWRAQDRKLGREVALKVLPELFARDNERLARFEREARLLASFSHPNVAGIHGLEEHEGRRFLVMELVEGETLSERIRRGPLTIQEAAKIALQIAEAVEAAHEKGVVHRDLKPGNVMVGKDGRVKVLDFGLAKAMAPDAASGDRDLRLSLSPTLTEAMTGMGVLLGTAGYMSPEQARGKEVDRRADIWAFGCVLYEMLSGSRAFDGETVTDVLGAIVHKEPELEKLPPGVPRRLRRILEQCLQKDVTRRLQSMGDARIALQEWLENPDVETTEELPSRRSPWPWLAALVAAIGGLVVGSTWLAPREAPAPPRHLSVRLSEDSLWTNQGAAAVLSPDARHVAWLTSGADRIALSIRSLDQIEGIEITGGLGGSIPRQPFFSPDGKWLGFFTNGELRKVPVTGGSSITLASVSRPRGGSWGEDGRIVYAPESSGALMEIPAAGGTPKSVTQTPEGVRESHRWPQWLPGGEKVLFTVLAGDNEVRIEVVDVASGERSIVHPQGAYARYVGTGHILFVDQAALFALPFDAERGIATGSAMPVLEGIESQQADGEAQFDVAPTGDLIYKPGTADLPTFVASWADSAGRLEPLWEDPGFYGTPRLSPDGRRLAISVLREGNWDVWIYDVERQVDTRLTFSAEYDADPVWSPDGRWIAFASERDGEPEIYRKRSDGSGEAERLEGSLGVKDPYPYDWTPDGRRILVSAKGEDGRPGDLWWLPLEGEPEPFLTSSFQEREGKVSPDGRWVAYRSDETGRPEIFVRSIDADGKWQISDGLAFQPLWSASGKELYFRGLEGLYRVEIELGERDLRAGRPELLFGEPLGDPWGVNSGGYIFEDYDVVGEGERFVIFPRALDRGDGGWVRLYSGWFQILEQLTAP